MPKKVRQWRKDWREPFALFKAGKTIQEISEATGFSVPSLRMKMSKDLWHTAPENIYEVSIKEKSAILRAIARPEKEKQENKKKLAQKRAEKSEKSAGQIHQPESNSSDDGTSAKPKKDIVEIITNSIEEEKQIARTRAEVILSHRGDLVKTKLIFRKYRDLALQEVRRLEQFHSLQKGQLRDGLSSLSELVKVQTQITDMERKAFFIRDDDNELAELVRSTKNMSVSEKIKHIKKMLEKSKTKWG